VLLAVCKSLSKKNPKNINCEYRVIVVAAVVVVVGGGGNVAALQQQRKKKKSTSMAPHRSQFDWRNIKLLPSLMIAAQNTRNRQSSSSFLLASLPLLMDVRCLIFNYVGASSSSSFLDSK